MLEYVGIVWVIPLNMRHYDYVHQLEEIWRHAVELYRAGVTDVDSMFVREQITALRDIGQSPQEMFDYAEDYVTDGEPTFGDVVAVAAVRRAYFAEVQGGVFSERVVESKDLPSRVADLGGVVWLPRIIVKARAKLRGELHPSIMYGCAGDRAFLKRCDIHPAEFLRRVWLDDGADDATTHWVLKRIAEKR